MTSAVKCLRTRNHKLKPPGSLLATDHYKVVVLVLFLLNVFGVGVSCRNLLSHLLIARCDIGVQLSIRSFVRSFIRPSVHNLCQGAYSVAVIAGSVKPCIVITLDTLFKQAP